MGQEESQEKGQSGATDPVGVDELAGLSEHDLLAGGVVDGVSASRATAARWARLVALLRRYESDQQARRADEPHFTLTARAEVVTEVSALWGWEPARVRREVNVAVFLADHFPEVWEMCLSGRLPTDLGAVVAEHLRHGSGDVVVWRTVARRLTGFLERHLSEAHGIDGLGPLVVVTAKQLRNKLDYELRRLRAPDAEARHRKAKAQRSVRSTPLPDAMGQLAVTGTVDEVLLAEQRLTHAAREVRRRGDERTIAQLKADLALDLLIGRGEDVPVPAYARPVVNVTVPIQTLMGVADEPGTLSGGSPVPAGLARAIAAKPGATWYRMLTDPAGKVAELSTTSYQPTGPIWREVVATWGSCFEPACTAPATTVELDHRLRWPEGPTSPGNLWPACKRGHTAKHAPGVDITQDADGSFRVRTRAGFTHEVSPPAPPVTTDWTEVAGPEPGEESFSAVELVDALLELRMTRDRAAEENRSHHRVLAWEHDPDPLPWLVAR